MKKLKRSIMKFLSRITTIFILFIFLSCEILTPIPRQHDIPRFSVDPLSKSGVPGSSASLSRPRTNYSYLPSLLPMGMIKAAVAQEQIDCRQELIEYNNAPDRTGNVERLSGIELVESFYREAIFYDCNTRYTTQFEKLGVSQQVLDSITTDEDGNDVPVFKDTVLLTAHRVNDPQDDLLFISWTDTPESENVRGKMVSKMLNDSTNVSFFNDGEAVHSKHRIDLKILNSLRTINSTFKHQIRHLGHEVYSKAVFIEVQNSNGNVNEHHIGGRYVDSFKDMDKNTIVEVQASVRQGIGTSVFLVHISACSGDFNLSQRPNLSSCQVSRSEEYYNKRGKRIDRSEAMEIGLKTNNSSLPRVDSFYGTQTEETFFRPVF